MSFIYNHHLQKDIRGEVRGHHLEEPTLIPHHSPQASLSFRLSKISNDLYYNNCFLTNRIHLYL